jgi:hypothetical protein
LIPSIRLTFGKFSDELSPEMELTAGLTVYARWVYAQFSMILLERLEEPASF